MRHGKKIAHLGRKTAHRSYMLANMACSLIEHKSINTTVTKAKALKRYIEPLITKSKTDSTHNRRIVFSYLKNKYAVTELFRDISVKIGERPGGYTRVIKLGNRLGDNASMAMIELVDYNTIYNSSSDTSKKTRKRKKSSSKSDSVIEDAVIVDETLAVEETVVEIAPVIETTSKAVKEEKTPVVKETNSSDASNIENNESKSSNTEEK